MLPLNGRREVFKIWWNIWLSITCEQHSSTIFGITNGWDLLFNPVSLSLGFYYRLYSLFFLHLEYRVVLRLSVNTFMQIIGMEHAFPANINHRPLVFAQFSAKYPVTNAPRQQLKFYCLVILNLSFLLILFFFTIYINHFVHLTILLLRLLGAF